MGGGGGGDDVQRMRLLSSVSVVALLLKRCRLLCEALVAASYCFSFETSTMQKPRAFFSFPDKNFENDAKNQLKKGKKSLVFATLSQKRYQKTGTKNMGNRKRRHIVLLTKTSTIKGFA